MANLAKIQSIAEGQFFVKDSLGNLTELKVGDTVSLNDTIVAASSNTDLSKIEILFDTNELITLSQGEQLLDTTLLASTFGNEELAFDKQEVDETLNAWNNAEAGDATDMETAAGDVTEQATNAGDENAQDGGALRSKFNLRDGFNSRDGDATDIVSDLREASWTGGIERTIEDSENMLLEDPLPVVYTIIEGIDVVNEGDSANYVVKLQDAAGNPVIATQDTIIYVRYTNKTTQDGDTQYNNENIIEVVIKAGTSQTEFTIKTNDDYLADNGEIYNVAITGNNSTEFDMRTGDVAGNKTNVDTTILDNSNPLNPGGEDNGFGAEDIVFAIIEGTATVNEGDTAQYVVKLVDKDGNPVTVTKDTEVIIKYTNKTTQDGDTEYNNNDTIKITIKAGENSSDKFDVDTIDDYLADNGEKFNLEITNVDDQGQFEKVNIGDINGDKTNVDTTILDNSKDTPNDPYDQTTTPPVEGDLDTITIKLFALDKDGNRVPANEVAEGSPASYVAVAFDKNGVELTLNETVEVTFGKIGDSATAGGVDYNSTTQTVTLGKPFSTNTVDDYLADNGEKYSVQITDKTLSNASKYETVVIDTTSVTTTILDNSKDTPNDPYDQTTTPPVEGDLDTITIKLFALDKDGNRVPANEVAEGSPASYVAVAFDKNGVELTLNETVEVTFGKIGDSATAGGVDYNSTTQTVTLGKPFSTNTVDDYLADNGEKYSVQITDKTLSNASKYETVVIDTTSVTTTILDNSKDTPNDPYDQTTTPPVEGDLDTITIKLFALDKDGNRVPANEVAEGSPASYVAVAFDKNGVELTLNETVEVTFGKIGDSATAGGVDYNSTTQTVTLGKPFSTNTVDDYLADNGEKYSVQITDKTLSNASKYETVVIDTTSVTTTIKDNTTTDPNNPSTIENNQENVILKIVAVGEDGNPIIKDGKYTFENDVAEGSNAKYMVLAFKPGTTEFKTTDVVDTQAGTVTIKTTDDTAKTTGTKDNAELDYVSETSKTITLGEVFEIKTLDDYLKDDGEKYKVSINDKTYEHPASGAIYENVVTNTDPVTTTIKDNTAPNTETNVEDVKIVLVAVSSATTTIADITNSDGTLKVTNTNETPEGGKLYYIAVAVDKDGKPLATQGGDVTINYGTTSNISDKDATAGVDYDNTTKVNTKVGVVFEVKTNDDYYAEGDENFTVKITDLKNSPYETPSIDTTKDIVTSTIKDNAPTINGTVVSGGEDTDGNTYGAEDTVYAIITGETTVNEGGVVTYTVKLVDKDGNTVIPTKETTVTVTYTNIGTTSTDDTNKTNNQEIAVKIDASGKGTFTVETKDDYWAEADENYNVKITNVQNTGEFENVKFDSPSNNVTTRIQDNPSKVEQPDTGTGNDDPINGSYGKEDTVYVKIEGSPTVVEGGKLSHTVTLVDKDGNPVTIPAGESVTVTLTYKEPTNDKNPNADDYITKTVTVTIQGGTSSTTFENITKVDFVTEGKEVYEITISKVEQSGAFENVAIHSQNTVTDTILDGITFGTPVYSKVDEDNFYQNDLNGTDGGNVTKSNLTASESLGITIPAGYEDIVGEYKINFNGEPKVMVDGQDYELKSNGVKVVYEVNGDKIVGKAGSKTVFDIVLNKTTGKYEYKQYENIDHPKVGEVSTEEGLKQNNTLDDIVLNFQFNITTTSKNGQTVTSPSQEFKVTVNDSTPIAGEQNLVVYEDNSLQFIISDEGFKGNTIEISNDGGNTYKTLTTSSTNGANSIDILENGQKIGTLKNLGSGKLQFIPEPDYSKYSDDNLPNFKYKVYDTDGDYAEGKVNIKVKPVADAPTVTVKNIETTEDTGNTQEGTNKVALELKVPSLSKDQTDKNNATGDSPERNGEITLKFTNGNSLVSKAEGKNIPNTGAKLFYIKDGESEPREIDNFLINVNKNLKIVIVETSGSTTPDTKYHYDGLNPTAEINEKVVYLTQKEYESLKIQHAEDNDTNIQINIGVTYYEVNDNGEPLFKNSSYDDNNNPNLYKNSNATMTVVIKPVTDDIELKFDKNNMTYSELQANGKFVTKEISGTISSSDSNTNKADTFTLSNTIKEGDGAINLQSILSATSGALNGLNGTKADLDGSEKRTYTISGIPEGTIIVLDRKSYTVQDGKTSIEIPFPSNTKADPNFSMKFPENFSGEVKATITLSVIDKGVEEKNNSTKWGETKEATVYLNLNVTPVADDATVKVGQPVGYEDAGRAGGNTSAKDGTITNPEKGIPLNIKVTSTDTDGSEKFELKIKNIPNGGALFIKDPITGKDVLVSFDNDGNPTLEVWNADGTKSAYTDGNIIANKGDVTITPPTSNSVDISGNTNDNQPVIKFIPPHNAHGDFKLSVDAKTVDTVKIDGVDKTHTQEVATNKDIVVVVKDVADSVVGNDYNKLDLVVTLNTDDKVIGTHKKYNAIVNEDDNGGKISLNSIFTEFTDATKLASYDSASEDLTIIIKDLPAGITLEGSVTLINGQYIFKASDIGGITIKTPVNYSGELKFDITYITTEKGEADNPSKTFDSKTTTDSVSIFVKPTIDAEFNSSTTRAEDIEATTIGDKSYYKLDLGISHKNGDSDETLVSAKLDKPADGDFKLFIKNSDGSFSEITDFTKTYTEAELKNIYVQAPENQHGNFDIIGTYTVKDSQYGSKDVNYETVKTDTFKHTLTITPVTDKPTITVEDGVQTKIEVISGEAKTIEIPIKVTSVDKDESENITKIVISGVPQGVTVDGLGFEELFDENDNSINVSLHNGIYTITGHNLNSSNFKDIVFKVDGKANFEYRDITITAYTKDAEGSKEEQTSTKITLDKKYNGNGGGTGTGPKLDIVVDETKKDFKATEDTQFNFLDVFKVTVANNSNDGRTELNFKIDVGSNATLKGLDAYKKADGSYTIKGNRADIESVLANLKVVPNKDFNSNQDADGISIKVETNGNESTIEVPVTPVTDSLNVEITANDSTTIDENGKFNFYIKLTNNSDKEFTNINDFYVVVNENFEAGESSKGELYLGNTKLELVDGKYKLPADYKLGDSLNLTYKSGEDRHGAVEIKVIAQNKETGATNELTSTGTTTITVKPVASSEIMIKDADKQKGIEDTRMASAKLTVEKYDPSEKFESVLIKVASGVAVYYDNGTKLAMNLGGGSWLIPVSGDGKTLPEIFFKGKEHLAGNIDFEATINVKDGEAKVTKELTGCSVTITEVADGVTIDPTKTGIDKNAFEWTSLNLNANMKDIDGSEKMHFTLKDLDSSAQFRVNNGDGTYTDLSSQAKFENGKWTINGIEAKDINSIEISHDKSVSGVKVEAWTVDGNVPTLSSVSGTFDLSYKADAKFSNGSFTLAKDMDIDFNNIGKLGFTNVEKIDLGAGNGKNELLNLTLQDVLDMGKKDGGNINLTILGDSQDKVSFKDEIGKTWEKQANSVTENNKTFDVYTNSGDPTVQVKVEEKISDGITS